MNRETIEKAAIDYIKPTAGIIPVAESIAARLGFMAGAEWRVNSVWHDVKEKPNGMFVILIDFGTRLGAEEYSFGMTSEHLEGAIRWAYVADLLPSGKEVNQ